LRDRAKALKQKERVAVAKLREKAKALRDRERAAAVKAKEKAKALKEKVRVAAAKAKEKAKILKAKERAAVAKAKERAKVLKAKEAAAAAKAKVVAEARAKKEAEAKAKADAAARARASVGGAPRPVAISPHGTRYICFSCAAPFYDLNRPEPVCPKCGTDQRGKPKPPSKPAARPKGRRKRAGGMAPLLEEDQEEFVETEERDTLAEGLEETLLEKRGVSDEETEDP
jgi:hypothetical protein